MNEIELLKDIWQNIGHLQGEMEMLKWMVTALFGVFLTGTGGLWFLVIRNGKNNKNGKDD